MAVIPEPTRTLPGLHPRRRRSKLVAYLAFAVLTVGAASLLAWTGIPGPMTELGTERNR
ncbi:hypothetical protein [Arenibaculum pallidiluteum]|uniref:hypothetical protein n=1 Tax=Arenibaculum pallidiluteum TaxID=2812559 RepID=UPI001A95BC65|nr:hypothetical protein [Arenibaculum pallidiluteum]